MTENGTEALEISDLELDDEAQYTCKIGDRESSAKMMVEKGENNWHLLNNSTMGKNSLIYVVILSLIYFAILYIEKCC